MAVPTTQPQVNLLLLPHAGPVYMDRTSSPPKILTGGGRCIHGSQVLNTFSPEASKRENRYYQYLQHEETQGGLPYRRRPPKGDQCGCGSSLPLKRCQHRERSSDFCVVSVTAFFVNFFMHSPRR